MRKESSVSIQTNNGWRRFKDRHDVPEKILASQFDWCDEDTGFIKYRGFWYHLSEFIRHGPGASWHGSASSSAFYTVFLRISESGETFQIGNCKS